jgi:hypothetical protein
MLKNSEIRRSVLSGEGGSADSWRCCWDAPPSLLCCPLPLWRAHPSPLTVDLEGVTQIKPWRGDSKLPITLEKSYYPLPLWRAHPSPLTVNFDYIDQGEIANSLLRWKKIKSKEKSAARGAGWTKRKGAVCCGDGSVQYSIWR